MRQSPKLAKTAYNLNKKAEYLRRSEPEHRNISYDARSAYATVCLLYQIKQNLILFLFSFFLVRVLTKQLTGLARSISAVVLLSEFAIACAED